MGNKQNVKLSRVVGMPAYCKLQSKQASDDRCRGYRRRIINQSLAHPDLRVETFPWTEGVTWY